MRLLINYLRFGARKDTMSWMTTLREALFRVIPRTTTGNRLGQRAAIHDIMALAGVLEIADREFQAIQDEDNQLKQLARTSVEKGVLDQVEITADALRSYLDRRIGSDARTTDFSYEYEAREVRRLGFTTIEQVDACIEGYDDDQLSRIRWEWRQGPLSRFEDMLLAGMGARLC